MARSANDPSRRHFLGKALQIGAGAAIVDSAISGRPTSAATPTPAPSGAETLGIAPMITQLPEMPARVFVDHRNATLESTTRQGTRFTSSQATVNLTAAKDGLAVGVACPNGTLARVILRWDVTFPIDALFLGDHWERGYGDLQWRSLQPERVMPWYFAAHDQATHRTFMAGVKTQPSALCFWIVDGSGVSLWMDFRNGGLPCRPGDREIPAATVTTMAAVDETPFSALTRFCRQMCPQPRLSKTPICGNNNWYYAYGQNFDADAMRRDAAFLADISSGHAVRPFSVTDAGWSPGSVCPGGPWTAGDPRRFPDMPGLAADIKKLGVRPGIWMRVTALTRIDDRSRLRAGPATAAEKPLDLTHPDNLTLIHDDIARICSWGYELIKDDFSTYDALGRWGFEMGPDPADGNWHFTDQSVTNAEIILRLYRTMREAAGDVILLGCNTIGHLGAGIFEIQRTGDDTSGKVWERTRRMGINTLAYRLPQNGAFFASDADCCAHTSRTPWEFDRQFLDLVSRSGTALFVSVDPRTITDEQKLAFRQAMQTALSGGTPGGFEPLDWLHSTTPCHWRLGNEKVTYHWEEASGAFPLKV